MKQLINLRTKSFIILCFIYFIFSPIIFSETEIIPSKAEWTVLIIAQTKGKKYDLEEFSLYNNFKANLEKVEELAKTLSGFNKKLNVLIQWEIPRLNGVWRYKITEKKLEFIQHLHIADYPEKIVDFVKWGVSNYPSKHLALILSGHGSGTLDPNITPVRGVLFNLENQTYLNNQQLSEAMSQIKKNILGGEKIDLIGMDACLMASIEVQYQIKDQATIFVASEQVELLYGWPCSEIFKELASRLLTPYEFANVIINTYGLHYQKNQDLFEYHPTQETVNFAYHFTQSAVNLEDIIPLKNNLDQMIDQLRECQRLYGDKIKATVKNARRECLQFNHPFDNQIFKDPIYVDLSSFYSELHKGLQDLSLPKTEDLEKSLTDGIKLIEKIVIANTTGKDITQAKGISIYYPNRKNLSYLDHFYLKTKFAQESKWLQFLKDNR